MARHAEHSLLLRICGACLQEAASLRREVQAVRSQSSCSPAPAADYPSSPLQVLRESCAIKDAFLREELTISFEKGKVATTLNFLRKQAHSAPDDSHVCTSVLTEVRQGAILAITIEGSLVKADHSSVETALLTDNERNCILVFPLFRHPTWALVDVLLRQCHQERMLVPVESLLEAIAVLMHKPGDIKMASVEESDMLLAIADAITHSGFPEPRARLAVDQSGRLVVRPVQCSASGVSCSTDSEKDLNSPLPLYRRGERLPGEHGSAPSCNDDAAQFDRATKSLRPHLGLVRAICGISGLGTCSDQGVAAHGGLGHSHRVGMVLGLLVVLRTLGDEGLAVELPAVSVGEVCGGALLWAFEHFAWSQMADPAGGSTDLVNDEKANGLWTSEGGLTETSYDEGYSYGEGYSPAMTPTFRGENQDVENPSVPCRAARTHDATDAQNEGQREQLRQEELKRETQLLFVQCFQDDLLSGRQLLMSQINNFYKMRNNDDSLRYKEAGYEKLHEFLLDIPGLTVYGPGNKMEIKVANVPAFQAFCQKICEGCKTHEFERPQPIPESIRWQIVEVFRRTGCREILARNFRERWSYIYPNERLHCKDFGYRDVKGLLGNVPMLEKVGNKHNTGYALKREVSMTGPLEVWAADIQPPGLAPEVPLATGPMGTSMLPHGAASMQQRPEKAVPAASVQSAPPLMAPQSSRGRASLGMTAQHEPLGHAEQRPLPVPAGALPARVGAACAQPAQQVQLTREMVLPGEVHDGEAPVLYSKVYAQRYQQQIMLPSKATHARGNPNSPSEMRLANTAGQSFGSYPSRGRPGPPSAEEVLLPSYGDVQPLMPDFQLAAVEHKQAGFPDPRQYNFAHPFHGSSSSYDASDCATASLEAAGQRYADMCRQEPEPPLLPGFPSGGLAMAPIGKGSGMGPTHLSSDVADANRAAPASLQPPSGARQLPRKAYASDPAPVPTRGPLSTNPLATAPYASEPITFEVGSLGRYSGWLPALRGEGSRVGLGTLPELGEGLPATEMETAVKKPVATLAEGASTAGSMPTLGHPGSVPTLGHPPGLEDVPRLPQPAEGPGADPAPPPTVDGHRMLRKQARARAGLAKRAGAFVTSPGVISTEERDVSKCQGKFDMRAFLHTQLRNDRPRLHVDFSSGRVLSSNSLCNHVFSTMCPLPQRDMADLIHEDDRLSFSARAMYLSIGRCSEMEPQALHFLTTKGSQQGLVSGELVVDSCWCLDITLLEDEAVCFEPQA